MRHFVETINLLWISITKMIELIGNQMRVTDYNKEKSEKKYKKLTATGIQYLRNHSQYNIQAEIRKHRVSKTM